MKYSLEVNIVSWTLQFQKVILPVGVIKTSVVIFIEYTFSFTVLKTSYLVRKKKVWIKNKFLLFFLTAITNYVVYFWFIDNFWKEIWAMSLFYGPVETYYCTNKESVCSMSEFFYKLSKILFKNRIVKKSFNKTNCGWDFCRRYGKSDVSKKQSSAQILLEVKSHKKILGNRKEQFKNDFEKSLVQKMYTAIYADSR